MRSHRAKGCSGVGKIASRFRRPILGVGTAILFMLSAYASHLAALQTSGLEALWPSNAIVLATLLLFGHSRKDILTIVAGQAVGSMLLHIFRADPLVLTGLLTCANVVESLLAFVLLRRIGIKGGLIDRVGNFFALVVAVGSAGLVSSTIGGLGLWAGKAIPFSEGWFSWYVSGVLSALMVTPTVVVAADIVGGRRMRGLTVYRLIEAAALLSLIAAVTSYVFLITRLPLTFIIAPCVLLATFRDKNIGFDPVAISLNRHPERICRV